MDDLGFTFEVKNNEVVIYRGGKKVTILRGEKAKEFYDDVDSMDFGSMQQLMARLTGNYKRGNEKHAKNIRKNRYKY
ncbi:hypothetical protein [Zooshikella sp. RANM57]|uniref:hypothetical protein n=1 Tax=Zooshikella sp. RANM57 TaxID=3425863 RepID=UPI003D6EA8CB